MAYRNRSDWMFHVPFWPTMDAWKSKIWARPRCCAIWSVNIDKHVSLFRDLLKGHVVLLYLWVCLTLIQWCSKPLAQVWNKLTINIPAIFYENQKYFLFPYRNPEICHNCHQQSKLAPEKFPMYPNPDAAHRLALSRSPSIDSIRQQLTWGTIVLVRRGHFPNRSTDDRAVPSPAQRQRANCPIHVILSECQ